MMRHTVIGGGVTVFRRSKSVKTTRFSAEVFRDSLPQGSRRLFDALVGTLRSPQISFVMGCRIYFVVAAHCVSEEKVVPSTFDSMCRGVLFDLNKRFGDPIIRELLYQLADTWYKQLLAGEPVVPDVSYLEIGRRLRPNHFKDLVIQDNSPHPFTFMTLEAETTQPKETAMKNQSLESITDPPVPDIVTPPSHDVPVSTTVVQDAVQQVAHPEPSAPVAQVGKVRTKTAHRLKISDLAQAVDAARERNMLKSAKDPRTDEQKARGFVYLKSMCALVDKMLETFPESKNPNRLSHFLGAFMIELTKQQRLDDFIAEGVACGWPEEEVSYVVMACVSGYSAMKLSSQFKAAHKREQAGTAVDEAFIYPPPKHPIAESCSRTLIAGMTQRKHHEASLESANAAFTNAGDVPQTSTSNFAGNPAFSTKEHSMSTQDQTAQAQASRVQDEHVFSHTETHTGPAADTTMNKTAETTTKTHETATEDGTYFSMAGFVSGLFMLLMAGVVLGCLGWLYATTILPWLTSLGLSVLVTNIIGSVIAVVAGGLLIFGVVQIGKWIFEKMGGKTGGAATTKVTVEVKKDELKVDPLAAAAAAVAATA